MTDLATIGVEVDTSDFDRTRRAFDNLGRAGDKAERGIQNNFETMYGSVRIFNAALSSTAYLLGTLAGVLSVRQIIAYSDAWTLVTNQIRLVTGAEQELVKVRSELLEVSNDTRQAISSTAELYAELTRSTQELNLTQMQQIGITETIGNLFLTGGKSAAATAGALRQLNQALASGVLRGEEFNSVSEGAPRILDAVALQLNMARGALREYAAEGKITSAVLANSLLNYQDIARTLAEDTEKTFAQQWTIARNNIQAFIGESETLGSIIEGLGNTVVYLSQNLGPLSDAVLVGSSALAVLALNSLATARNMSILRLAITSLLGPFGAVVGVVGASAAIFALQADRQDKARQAAEAHKKSLEGLTKSYMGLNSQGAALAYQQEVENINRLEKERIEVLDGIARRQELSSVEYVELRKRLPALNQEIERSNQRIDTMSAAIQENILRLQGWSKELISNKQENEKLDSLLDSLFKNRENVKEYQDAMASLQKMMETVPERALEIQHAMNTLSDEFHGVSESAELLDNILQEIDPESDRINKYNMEIQALSELFAVLPDRAAEIQRAINLLTAEFSDNGASEWFAELKQELEGQRIELAHGEDAYELYLLQMDALSNKATPQMLEALTKITKDLQKLRKETKSTEDELEKFQRTLDRGFDDSSTNFRSIGNAIVDSFGRAASVIGTMGDRMRDLNTQAAEYNEIINSQTASAQMQAEAQDMLNRVEQRRFQEAISGTGALLGATKTLFDENSKAREALHRLEMAFLAAEIAMATQKAIANAYAAITNQGSGDPYTAFGRIAAMTALMAGILGAIGATISGGGSAPTPNLADGTGTTLGDPNAQSGSIGNSFELFEDIQIDQLAELRGINRSMSSLVLGIGQLTRNLVGAGGLDTGFADTSSSRNGGILRSTAAFESAGVGQALGFALGGPIGAVVGTVVGPILDKITGGLISGLVNSLFGKTEREVVDSGIQFLSQTFEQILSSGQVEANIFAVVNETTKRLFGLVKNSSQSIQTESIGSEFANQLGDIFASIANTMLDAGELLGITMVQFNDGVELSLQDALSRFSIDEMNISLEGLTGDEIQDELEAVFGALSDDLASFLFPALQQYQQLNEGMFETVIRVTRETVIFEDALKALGITMDGLAAIDFGQAVISAIGGIDNFNDAFGQFTQNFYSESERMNILSQSLGEVFATLNLEMPTSLLEFRELVEQTAEMGSQGADTLAILLQINDAFAQLIETGERLSEQANSVAGRLIQVVDFFNAIRNDASTDFFENLRLTADSYNTLVEAFGSAESIANAVRSLANNFGDSAISMNVAQEAVASSISGIMSAIRTTEGIEATETEAAEALTTLRNLLRRTGTTADELASQMMVVINAITSEDVDSGLFTELLNVQGPISDYINALREQEQAALSAAEAERALQDERDGRTLDLYVDLLRSQGNELEAISLERAREIELLQQYDDQNQTNLASIQSLIYLQEDWNQTLLDSREGLESIFDILDSAVSAQRDTITQIINELEAARNRLSGALRNQESNRVGSAELARLELQSALQAARQGDFSQVAGLDFGTLTSGNTSGFESREQFELDQAIVTASLKELQSLSENQISEEQMSLAALEEILSTAQNQLNAVLGVDESILSVAAAEALFNEQLLAHQALQLANSDADADELLALQQALMDAQALNFQALINLTDEERQQIIDHLNSLISSNNSFGQSLIAGNILLRTDLQAIYGAIRDLDATTLAIVDKGILQQLKVIDESIWYTSNNDEVYSTRIVDAIKVLNTTALQIADKGMLKELMLIAKNTTQSLKILNTHYTVTALNMGHNQLSLEKLDRIADTTLQIVDKAILQAIKDLDATTLAIADKGILSELQKLNSTTLQIVDKAILQAIKDLDATTLAIVDKGILAELQSIDNRLTGSGNPADAASATYLKSISTGVTGLYTSLVNDGRRKISMPNSHYANQQAVVAQMKKMNSTLQKLTNNNWHQNNGIAKNTASAASTLQKMQLDGIEIRD